MDSLAIINVAFFSTVMLFQRCWQPFICVPITWSVLLEWKWPARPRIVGELDKQTRFAFSIFKNQITILFIGSGMPYSAQGNTLTVKLRLPNEWEEGTGQKLFERSEFFWPGVFVSFFAKKESPRQGMEVASAIRWSPKKTAAFHREPQRGAQKFNRFHRLTGISNWLAGICKDWKTFSADPK